MFTYLVDRSFDITCVTAQGNGLTLGREVSVSCFHSFAVVQSLHPQLFLMCLYSSALIFSAAVPISKFTSEWCKPVTL